MYCSSSSHNRECSSVGLDEAKVGEMAAEHLIDCNLKHFGFYPNVEPGAFSESRYQSFRARVEQSGFTCDLSDVLWPEGSNWLAQKHYARLTEWIRQLPKPVGILAADDVVGHDLARCCQQAGVSVPDEVAIIGVNNDELICEGSWPPMSSIASGFSRVGFRAAELLDSFLHKEQDATPHQAIRLPPLGVIRRTSTSILEVSDPLLADAVRYIRAHACDPCNVEDVLRHVPIARRKLERRFTEELGRTPHQEIQRVRLLTAERMLVDTDLALPQVAQRCGFAAASNFNNAFRKQFDQTPAAYRRAAKDR